MSQQSGYRLLNVLLLESYFTRADQLSNEDEILNSADVEINHSEINDQNQLHIKVTIKYWSVRKDNPERKEIDARITMIGIFKSPDNPQPTIETFSKINGPAIIFPFIREHLSNLTAKAGLQPVLLPAINFSAVDEGKEKEE